MTKQELINQTAAEQGYTMKPIGYSYYKYSLRSRSICVYYGVAGQVISASWTTSTKSRNILGTGKAAQVINFLEGN